MKRLAIFLDGTWNDPGSETNVHKLYSAVAAQGTDGVQQLTYYDPGVGTTKYQKILGGAVGLGLSKNVRDAYSWLLQNYVDNDEVYVIGFSRGAYTLGGRPAIQTTKRYEMERTSAAANRQHARRSTNVVGVRPNPQ